MAILGIDTSIIGLTGVSPRIIYIFTTDSLATITTAGYLNKAAQNGYDFSNGDMALVYGSDLVGGNAGCAFFALHVTEGSVSLVATESSISFPLAVNLGGTGVASVTSSPTASAWAGWDASKNLSCNNLIEGYATTATAAGTTTLTVSSAFLQYFTGTTTQTVRLPSVASLALGQQFFIVNNSTGVVTVQSSGSNTIQAMSSGTKLLVTCISLTGTDAASWDAQYSATTAGVQTVSGTANRVTSSGGVNPVIDISASYVGQASITTLGTVATGTWNADTIAINHGGTGVTSVTSSPTASAWAGWDADKNLSANNVLLGYTTTVTGAATTTLTASSAYQQYFTGVATQTVVLPVVSTLALGTKFELVNNSTGVVTVQSSGGNTIQAMAANSTLVVTSIATSGTDATVWNANYSVDGGGVASITGTTNQVIASAATGNVTLSLPQDINTTSNPVFNSVKGGNLTVGGNTISNNVAGNVIALQTTTDGDIQLGEFTNSFQTNPGVYASYATTAGGVLGMGTWGATATGPSFLSLAKSRGILPGDYTAVQAGDILGQVQFLGTDGAAFINTAKIRATATGTISTGVVPATMSFFTTNASGVSTLAATISEAQVLTLANALPPASGGTGINNGTSTLTLGGNTTFSGAYSFTGTLTGNTSVTFPTSGTLSTVTKVGDVTSGAAFDGTAGTSLQGTAAGGLQVSAASNSGGNGATVSLVGGATSFTNGDGGSVSVVGGASNGSGTGGSVVVKPGNGAGPAGDVTLGLVGTGTTGSNINAGHVTIANMGGSGTGTLGYINMVCPAAGTASGTTAMTQVNRLYLNGSVTNLTSGVASTILTLNLANTGDMGAGQVFFVVEAVNATDQQVSSGSVRYSCIRRAGPTYVGNTISDTNATSASAGTLNITPQLVNNTLQLTVTSSLGSLTALRVTFTVMNHSQTDITI